ncbi:MAG TPA: hypothetical protein ENJ27_01945 [Candidatus Moranbacteria bacterium]|nr:hypothetical protein [Candidatus Moranbacteria bacterium]
MKILIKKIRHNLWKLKMKSRLFINFLKRRFTKIKRLFIKEKFKEPHNFAISCTKRLEYADMAIKNINSMHYLNPKSKFVIYCDDICFNYLNRKKFWFDYPKQTTFKKINAKENKTWQEYKTEMLIDASKKDLVCVDADAIWHSDPKLDKNKITFLLISRKMKEKESEKFLMESFFGEKEWSNFYHYTTGFLSLPSKFVTPKFEKDCARYLKEILNEKFETLSKENREGLYRLSEQIALNIAVQTNYPADKITVLKPPRGGPKDTNILQSLYYGCANRVLK